MKIEIIYKRLIGILKSELKNSCQNYYVLCASLDNHNNIISLGKNSYQKTHPLQKRLAKKCGNGNRSYLHAEIASLVKNRQKPFSIIVIRMTIKGIVRMARPCNICTLALREAQVRYMYYSDNTGKLCREEILYNS